MLESFCSGPRCGWPAININISLCTVRGKLPKCVCPWAYLQACNVDPTHSVWFIVHDSLKLKFIFLGQVSHWLCFLAVRYCGQKSNFNRVQRACPKVHQHDEAAEAGWCSYILGTMGAWPAWTCTALGCISVTLLFLKFSFQVWASQGSLNFKLTGFDILGIHWLIQEHKID